MSALHLEPGQRFSFGLGAGGQTSRDGAGCVRHPGVEPCELVYRLGDLGCWGVSVHDDEIAPPGSSSADRDDAVERLRKALADTGMVVSMAVTDLAGHPVFADGAFTASDRDVRRYAIHKAMRAIDLGAELGARTHGFRAGERVGVSVTATSPLEALARYREAIDFLCSYVDARGYDTRLALQPAPDAYRGDAVLPTVGHALAFIATLDRPELVGLDPDAAGEVLGGLGAVHGVAQAVEAGKLSHIELNPLPGALHDDDGRFGSERIATAFYLVKLLEESGYDGARHFRIGPARAADPERLAHFAHGCMRTYVALAAKARRFADDPEIQDALAECGVDELADATVGRFTTAAADELAAELFDPEAIAARGYSIEHLERTVDELILGLR
jgi:xylose isomerase